MTRHASPEPLTTGNAWYLTVVVFLAYLVGQIDRQIIVMLADEMKRGLAFSDEQLGVLMGLAFSVAYALGALWFAQLAERAGRKRVLLFGIVLWSLATVACSLVKSFEGLLIARIVVGLGEGALAPTALPLVSAAFSPERRSFPLAFCTSGAGVGLIVTPLATGVLLSQVQGKDFGPFPVVGIVHGWQTGFLLAGVVGLFVAALLLTLRDDRRTGSGGKQAAPAAHAYSHFRQHMRFYLAVFAAVPIGVAPGFALISWMPIYLQRVFGMSAAEAGTTFGLAFVPAVLVGPILGGALGQFASRMSNKRAYFDILAVLAAFGFVVMATPMLMSTVMAAIAAFAIAIFFMYVTMTLGTINSQQLVADRFRGQATAILLAVQMTVGAGLGPYLVGLFATRVVGEDSLHLAMILLIAITGPLAIAILILARLDRSELSLAEEADGPAGPVARGT